ncbi:ribosomal protection-like ABC-F family protein [Coleofasciculus sp. FACHB-T130]|uniref:ribosomal protection-like ABC-F family protein n=1 Tax=Cyanophyceae TaxID=3028117 RepID=UPI0016825EDE|nr:ABC-F family ATP-binding cassette domain-containing protein [Coleofasciculus sp. FACHB-T130]MBD1881796.1 ABC-F family ATP-binding cassette domain-containing protein [Coleofasciculus sp. FACHB-T130]
MQKKSFLTAEQISYELASDQTLFTNVQATVNEGDRIALVGANGVGKSTLLKILAGEIQPSSGSVNREGTVYYLPQISTLIQSTQGATVFDFLSYFSEDWWEISNLLEAKLKTSVDISLPVSSLSGGELTKLLLAIGLYRNPSVLLLDEPTNHLDFLALENLKHFLQELKQPFVLVSHKPFFLDQVVNTIWELTPLGVKVYGGNFSSYKEQKEIEFQVALRTREIAKKELKQATDASLQEEKRAGKSRREGRKQAHDRSMGKSARRYFENRASASAGSASKKNEVAIAKATQNLESAKIRTNPVAIVRLEEERSKKGRSLIDIQGANLKIGSQFLIKNIQMHIASGERVAISGANGSGKSSLIRAVLDIHRKNSPAILESGKVSVAPKLKVVYLDQTYEIVDRGKTILENLQAANPNLEYQLIRQQLGHFLFFNDEVNKKAEILSGGELARLALATISVSEIELLVLDEPTNNLDLETVTQIVEALEEYRGAILVISHDIDFLSRIQITKAFKIQNKAMRTTVFLPDETEQYYQELLA